MANFTIRNTSPAGLYLPYYMTTGSGGLNTCIVGNQAVQGANVLYNCTGFSQGRCLEVYYEITAGASGNPFAMFNGDAETWYQTAIDNGFNVGQTPRIGAIGVYYNGIDRGHVCNIEQYANGRWEISESHYYYDYQQGVVDQGSWDYSYLNNTNFKPEFIQYDNSWFLIGFIYPFDNITPIGGGGMITGIFGNKKIRSAKRRGRIILL